MIKQLLLTAFIMGTTIISDAQTADSRLIEVASFGENQPIGVTVAAASNRLFVSFPHHEPYLYGLTEIVNGKRIPYPNAEWNKVVPEQTDTHFVMRKTYMPTIKIICGYSTRHPPAPPPFLETIKVQLRKASLN